MFDFDATLLCMALQFVALTLVMDRVFFKPLTKVLDERDEYIRTQNGQGRERLEKAEQLAQQYEQELADTRRESQAIIAAAQAEAQQSATQEIAEAQKQVRAEVMKVQQELETQKQDALSNLEQDVNTLSRQILNKLIGDALAASS